ncbi:MAG: hypothetical protein HC837_17090 [Chloroflexaceae bacterium]|nr:hypothetical protein [Chloroflexaceae bacterium]
MAPKTRRIRAENPLIMVLRLLFVLLVLGGPVLAVGFWLLSAASTIRSDAQLHDSPIAPSPGIIQPTPTQTHPPYPTTTAIQIARPTPVVMPSPTVTPSLAQRIPTVEPPEKPETGWEVRALHTFDISVVLVDGAVTAVATSAYQDDTGWVAFGEINSDREHEVVLATWSLPYGGRGSAFALRYHGVEVWQDEDQQPGDETSSMTYVQRLRLKPGGQVEPLPLPEKAPPPTSDRWYVRARSGFESAKPAMVTGILVDGIPVVLATRPHGNDWVEITPLLSGDQEHTIDLFAWNLDRPGIPRYAYGFDIKRNDDIVGTVKDSGLLLHPPGLVMLQQVRITDKGEFQT